MQAPTERIARRTPRNIYRRDRAAEAVIRVGGGAVLVAVLGICVYLALVVLPIFRAGSIGPREGLALDVPPPLDQAQLDEYVQGALVLDAQGVLEAFHLPTGTSLGRRSLAAGDSAITAVGSWTRGGRISVGYADGSIQTGVIRFRSQVRAPEGAEIEIPPGRSRPAHAPGEDGWIAIIERVDEGQVRVTTPQVELPDPAPVEAGEGPVRLIDAFSDDRSEFVVVVRESGPASYSFVRTIRPLGGGKPRVRLSSYPFEIAERGAPPDGVFVSGDGQHVFVLWDDGTCQRYAAHDVRNAVISLAETVDVTDGRSVGDAVMLIGAQTLVVGDDAGYVSGWFPAPDPLAPTPDRHRLVRGHKFRGPGGPITTLATSWRDRSVLIGDATGGLVIRHMASEKLVIGTSTGDLGLAAGAIAPKNDAFLALGSEGSGLFARYAPGYPELTFRSLFGRVHYEGQLAPGFVYQSSAGDDAAEAKLSLTPLIFGTLKATIVAMLFACPVAVFAAIYSSEFLSPGVRRTVKPAIEIMASLPSVVLGFIAAIVIAPLARDLLPAVMLAMVVVPLVILVGAGIWTTVPNRYRSRFKRKTQIVLVTFTIFAGLLASLWTGPFFERLLFRPTEADLLVLGGSYEPVAADEIPPWVGVRATMGAGESRMLRQTGLYFREGAVVRPVPVGPSEFQELQAELARHRLDQPSIRRWLNGEIGGPWPGWLVAMMPVGAILGLVACTRASSLLRRVRPSERLEVLIAVGQPWLGLAIALVAAAVLATLLTAMGFDARDSIFGTFTPRNTLVVGIIMGFAIIPIIFTISEDALMSVPPTLRAASLGAGASPWQTAVRVVLPVAASGIFSASMIGLGRAVGETMIVLMATGNTPTMNLNIFEGFRTLAANIAVELPEAPKGDALYRVLFLCGLVLFLMTFVINTTAELVRQHYRRKNALL